MAEQAGVNLYHYRARLIRVVDGDTIDVDLDLGFHLRARHRLRLLGVDTPERGEPGFAEATATVRQRLEAAQELVVWTVKPDSFGRWLASVWADGRLINDELVGMGYRL